MLRHDRSILRRGLEILDGTSGFGESSVRRELASSWGRVSLLEAVIVVV